MDFESGIATGFKHPGIRNRISLYSDIAGIGPDRSGVEDVGVNLETAHAVACSVPVFVTALVPVSTTSGLLPVVSMIPSLTRVI